MPPKAKAKAFLTEVVPKATVEDLEAAIKSWRIAGHTKDELKEAEAALTRAKVKAAHKEVMATATGHDLEAAIKCNLVINFLFFEFR